MRWDNVGGRGEDEGGSEACIRATHLPAMDILHNSAFGSEIDLTRIVRSAVSFGEKERNEVDPGPNLLAFKFSIEALVTNAKPP